MLLTSWLRSRHSSSNFAARLGRSPRRCFEPAAERLEDRTLLTAYVVDTLDDTVAADGKVSLREAIQASNTNAAVNEAAAGQAAGVTDSISFSASLAGGTITLGGTRLDVTGALAITGLGSTQLTISGNNASQIFATAAAANLSVSGLTLTRGFASSASFDTWDGGAVYNEGTLTLSDVVLRDSTASFRGAILYNEGTVRMTGGTVRDGAGSAAIENRGAFTAIGTTFADNASTAVGNQGALTLENCLFENNQASSGAAIDTFGSSAVTVRRSTFRNNHAVLSGGAISNFGDSFRIFDSTFTGNTANSGGAIDNFSSDLEITGSTFFANQAKVFHGGAIDNSSGDVRISNSTISGNEAGWHGGGVYTFSGSLTLRNVTVFANRVNVDGGGFEGGAGIYQSGSSAIALYNTIVIGNLKGAGAGVTEDIYGSVSGRNNLIGTAGAAGGLVNGVNGNIVGATAAAVLDPVLRNNGGPTLTHALVVGGLAVDAGSNADARTASSPGTLLTRDQRGLQRIGGAAVDIGAYEVPTTVVVDTSADEDDGDLSAGDLSLREAVKYVATGGTVTFAAALAGGTITLGGTEIALTRNVTIAGLGASQLTVSGNDVSRVFDVAAGVTAGISGLTFTDGRGGEGGAIRTSGTLTISDSVFDKNTASASGGAIFSRGSLAVDRTSFSENVATGNGGAIASFGSLTVDGGGFSGNQATQVGGAIAAFGDARVIDAVFTGNAATLDGGALINFERLTVAGCFFSSNSSDFGGALYNDGTLLISSSEISENSANFGGALFNAGAATISEVDFTSNTAHQEGGAIRSVTDLTVVDSNFSDNSAGDDGGAILTTAALTVTGSDFSANSAVTGGGAICGHAAITLTGGTFTDNTANFGGAVLAWDQYSVTTVTSATFTANRVNNEGGAIHNRGILRLSDSTLSGNLGGFGGALYNYGTAKISGSTFAGNISNGDGGAIYEWGISLTVANSTFSGNTARSDGGAFYNLAGPATLRNVTIVFNRADSDGNGTNNGDGDGKGGGIWTVESLPVTLHNTIVAGNFAGLGTDASDVFGHELTAGSSHNLIGDSASAGGLTHGLNGNVVGAAATAVLDPVLRDNGGPTKTHALVAGSLAVNRGSNALALDSDGQPLTTDQRGAGFSRALNGIVDVGAFERTNADAVARDDDASASENSSSTGDLFTNNGSGADSDADADPLAVVAVNGVTANVGTTLTLASGAILRVNANGTFTYDPNGKFEALGVGETAIDTFSYTVSDGFGGQSSAGVTMTIVGENDDPTATGVNVMTGAPDSVTGRVTATDLDGGPLVFSLATNPAKGTALVAADGNFTYTPAAGAIGSDSFTVFVSDGRGGTAAAAVTVFIQGPKADLVGFEGGRWRVGVSDGTAFDMQTWATWVATGWQQLGQADFDGDGRTDVYGFRGGDWWVGRSNGTSFVTGWWAGWVRGGWDEVHVADLNGDGKDDILARRNGAAWWAALSTGTTFAAPTRWALVSGGPDRFRVEDATGDGKADLVERFPRVGGERMWVRASDGTKFGSQTDWLARNTPTAGSTDYLLGDFNGDGRQDAFRRDWNGSLVVSLSTGSGFVASTWGTFSGEWRDLRVGDFDGDGKDDLAARQNGAWNVFLSDGTTFTRSVWGHWYGVQSAYFDVTVGDFNGDGRDDLAGRDGGNWWVSLSNGSAFTHSLWSTTQPTFWRFVGAGHATDGIPRTSRVATMSTTGSLSISSGSSMISGGSLVSFSPTFGIMGIALVPAPAVGASLSAAEEPLRLFWSQARDDEDFAGRLLAV